MKKKIKYLISSSIIFNEIFIWKNLPSNLLMTLCLIISLKKQIFVKLYKNTPILKVFRLDFYKSWIISSWTLTWFWTVSNIQGLFKLGTVKM